jgi:hypothetical protein
MANGEADGQALVTARVTRYRTIDPSPHRGQQAAGAWATPWQQATCRALSSRLARSTRSLPKVPGVHKDPPQGSQAPCQGSTRTPPSALPRTCRARGGIPSELALPRPETGQPCQRIRRRIGPEGSKDLRLWTPVDPKWTLLVNMADKIPSPKLGLSPTAARVLRLATPTGFSCDFRLKSHPVQPWRSTCATRATCDERCHFYMDRGPTMTCPA